MVLGTVIPVLVKDGVFGSTDASVTTVATTGLIGMTIGATTTGTVTDYLGRRKVMIFAVIVFSIFTVAVAFAKLTSPRSGSSGSWPGLGLGGCLPTAITLVTEFARKGKASSATTTVMTGYHVGAVLTALLRLVVMGNGHGWQWMFVIGGVPGLLLAPLMMKYDPSPKSSSTQTSAWTRGRRSRPPARIPSPSCSEMAWRVPRLPSGRRPLLGLVLCTA